MVKTEVRGGALQSELTALIAILEEQRDLQASLVSLSELKIKTITIGDSASLQGIVEDEKGVLAKIKAIEKKQTQCIDRIAVLLVVSPQDVRMSLIIEKAEGTQKESLTKLRGELSDLVEKQINLNEMNMKLLKMNLDYVQFLINTTSRQQVGPTYGSQGNIGSAVGRARNLLDRKV